jgi:multidrug resistance efflux pump
MKAQWIKKERELEQEKENVRKQAALFKQASDDARKMMEKAQSNAHSEIEAARATVLRVEASLMEHVESLGIAEKQELEEMRKQIIEARRIKMLHEPSKV